MTPKIQVNNAGVEIAYSDSGLPDTQCKDYITVFAIHGTGFSRAIFDKVATLAPENNIRWVSISRRNYPGSSPYSESELQALQSGDESQRRSMLQSIGADLANFYDIFTQKYDIPAISEDGKSGGIAILGWSSGCTSALLSLIQINSLSAEAKARMSCRIRTLILEDPVSYSLGLPSPPKQYNPLNNVTSYTSLANAISSFATWVAGYFLHEKLSSRSVDALSYTTPERSIIDSIPPEIVIRNPGVLSERPLVTSCQSEIFAIFRDVVFNESLELTSWPRLQAWIIAGEKTIALSIASLWAVEDLDGELGGGFIKSRMIKDVNHFVSAVPTFPMDNNPRTPKMHWDHPELTMQVYLDCLHDSLRDSLYRDVKF